MNIWFLVSTIGSPTLWMLASIILLVVYAQMREFYWKGNERSRHVMKKFMAVFLVSLIVAFGATYMLKEVVNIPRPCAPCPADGCNPYCPADNSFPSGHTATAFVLFTSLFIVLGRKRYLPVFAVPVLVGTARVMLGVHTWLDITGGAVLALAVVSVVWYFERKYFKAAG